MLKNCKKTHVSILGLLLGAAVFFPIFSARATDYASTDYIVKDPVISHGVGTSASTSFQNIGTMSQPATGISNSTSYVLDSGFLYFPAPDVAPSSSTPLISGSAFGGSGGGSGGGGGASASAPSEAVSSPSSLSQPSSQPSTFVSQPSSPIPSSAKPLLASILEGIKNFVGDLLPLPSVPVSPQLAAPAISEKAPLALEGAWNLLSAKEIGSFVFTPLPQDIALLGEKFPTIADTLKAVGVARLSDLSKLRNIELYLPSITERIGMQPVALGTQPFALPRGIPISDLSLDMKARIPSEIVFVRIGGGKIDLPIQLKLQGDGALEKTVQTVVGSALHLVVKPEYAAKSVKGYLVLKSRTRRGGMGIREQTPLQNMLASMFFVRPVFAGPPKNASYQLLAGAGAVSADTSYRTDGSYRSYTTDTTDTSYTTDRSYGSDMSYTTDTTYMSNTTDRSYEKRLALAQFEYIDSDGDGIYTADVRAPAVDGEYEVITIISYQDSRFGAKEIGLTAVVDPEGYVFERNGGKETRIPGAVVSLFYLNPATKKYEVWPGRDYTQENPQVTDVRGTYAFLAPPGTYSISVTAPGYPDYRGKPFQLSQNNEIHMNIEMKSSYGFLAAIDLKNVLLILLFLLVGYNFYKDKVRGMRTPGV